MTQHRAMPAFDRRQFLTSAAGLTLALTVAPEALTFADEALAEATGAPASLTAWVTIAPDGATTIVSPAAELGQGTFTTLALVLADELDVDWSTVKVGYPPVWDEKTYGNPQFSNFIHTVASMATRGYFTPMRIAGAPRAARRGGGEMERADRRVACRAVHGRSNSASPHHLMNYSLCPGWVGVFAKSSL